MLKPLSDALVEQDVGTEQVAQGDQGVRLVAAQAVVVVLCQAIYSRIIELKHTAGTV